MIIQINSDNNITGTEGLSNFVESTVVFIVFYLKDDY